jgi:predicted secreted protein
MDRMGVLGNDPRPNMKTLSSNQKRPCGPGVVALVVTFLLTALSVGQARAAEESGWACLGFSDAGDHVAVETFGVREDTGAAFSTIRVIDVKANRFAAPAVTTCIGKGCEESKDPAPTAKEARTRNHQKARSTLAQFGIGENLHGERSLLSAKSRTVQNPGSGAKELVLETAQFPWLGVYSNLVLRELAASQGKNPPRMIDLRLQRSGTEVILQKDESIPKSRGTGISSYELEAVTTYKNSLLVVLRFVRPGHQGEEASQLFVTGQVAP